MATLHNEYISFNGEIRLTKTRKDELLSSKKAIKKDIQDWFSEKKPNELPPKFGGQGSFEMNTIINPIPQYDEEDNKLLEYDLDYGVYFIEKDGEDNKRSIETWHNWIIEAVKDRTKATPKDKNTCVRVFYADGHHIDLPIYYKKNDEIELAHKGKGWIKSDPKEFYEWFNDKAKNEQQLRNIVRYLKAWKNYRENNNSSLKLPSGFALTILATNNFLPNDNEDIAFFDTITKIKNKLDLFFRCLRPTTPINEDLFANYSQTKKNDFIVNLTQLITACDDARKEDNFKKASEYIRNQFGKRFPLGSDESEKTKSDTIKKSISGTSIISPRPYYG